MKNKGLVVVAIVLALLVGILIGGFIFKDINLKKDGTSSKVEKNNIEILNITDKIVVDAVSMVRSDLLTPDVAGAYKTIFGGKAKVVPADISADDLFIKALDYYIESEKIEYELCTYEENETYTEINKKDLKGYFVEDFSYIDEIEENKEYKIVKYHIKNNKDTIGVCGGSYGFAGPDTFRHRIDVVSAYKEDNKLKVNVKFLYYDRNENYSDPDDENHFKFYVYDSLDISHGSIDEIDYYFAGSGYDEYSIDLNDYSTYELTFKLKDDNILFESILKK